MNKVETPDAARSLYQALYELNQAWWVRESVWTEEESASYQAATEAIQKLQERDPFVPTAVPGDVFMAARS